MLATKERNMDIRQERVNDYAPLHYDAVSTDYSFRNYAGDYRDVKEQPKYAEKYESIDFYNNQYQCASTENVFRPIELSDIGADVKAETRKKTKSRINISTKGKILVGVYVALVALVVALLLINAIPAVSAQAVEGAAGAQIVSEQAVEQSIAEAQSQCGLAKTEGYVYDTETNWFDRFCDGVSKFFK